MVLALALRRLALALMLAVHSVGSVETTPPRLGGERLPTSCTEVAFDIGSNNGEDTAALLGKNLCVLAVDANPAMVAKVSELDDGVRAATTNHRHHLPPPPPPPPPPPRHPPFRTRRPGRGSPSWAGTET